MSPTINIVFRRPTEPHPGGMHHCYACGKEIGARAEAITFTVVAESYAVAEAEVPEVIARMKEGHERWATYAFTPPTVAQARMCSKCCHSHPGIREIAS